MIQKNKVGVFFIMTIRWKQKTFPIVLKDLADVAIFKFKTQRFKI
jgi:hypothetical protein